MPNQRPDQPLLGLQQRREMLDHRSIIVATCGRDDNEPHLMRALGARFSDDGLECTVLLGRAQCRAMLEDIAGNGRIAVVFARPTTDRAAQIKGTDARIVPLERDDLQLIERYRIDMTDELQRIGYPPAFTAAMLACPPDGAVAVSFRPSAAFHQTPGAGAGGAIPVPG